MTPYRPADEPENSITDGASPAQNASTPVWTARMLELDTGGISYCVNWPRNGPRPVVTDPTPLMPCTNAPKLPILMRGRRSFR